MAEGLRVERRDAVALVVFDDPERRNAMTEAMGAALASAVARLAGDEAVRAVVLTGAGAAFSAGGDLAMIEARAEAGRAAPGEPQRGRNRAFMRSFYSLFLSLRELPQPTLAAINGPAIGAGLAVALACDLRIAARNARLGLNFTRLGIHPGMGSTWTLPRLVGPAHAADLLLTGRTIDAAEAERIGLVNRAVAPEELLPQALATAEQMAACAPLAVRGARRALRDALTASLDEQLDFEAEQQALCYESADLAEGLAAARERRAARFTGR
ncbi:MAG TPA: enoyl-CoA hydratase-related protein [Myxococcota bacterium]|nr:enoyl-CoA hydratase-related protein [Myxococcota bacterium]